MQERKWRYWIYWIHCTAALLSSSLCFSHSPNFFNFQIFLIWSRSLTPREIKKKKKKKKAAKSRVQLMFSSFFQGADLPTVILAILGVNIHCLHLYFLLLLKPSSKWNISKYFSSFLQNQQIPQEPASIPAGRDFQGKGKEVMMAPVASQIFHHLQEHPGKICWDQRKTRGNYVKMG